MNDTAPLDANGAITALAFPDGRRAAIEYIMAHAQEALPGLIAALEGGDPAAACRAAEALASLPEHTADTISPLGRQALYGPPAVAVAAVAALGNLPASRASVITLEEALRSERAEVRREAALSLARIEAQSVPALSRRAGTALTGLEADDVGAVCRAALVRLEPAPRARLFAAALQADLRAALEALDEGTARRTTADDAHELLLRPDILRALTRRLTPETAAILAAPVAVAGRALIDRAPHDAEIGHVVDAAALALLEALYVVREPIDRAPLLEALETLGPRAQRVLAGRLADEQPERVAPLAGVLAELDWRPTADQAGARYLIARGRWEECAAIGKEATGPLIEAFLESHAEQREQAAQALDRIGWRPTEERLQAPYLVALRRWEALDRLDGALAPHLAEEMAHERAEARRRRIPGYRLAVRLGLAESLARLGGPDAHEPLAAALAEDPAAAVRSAALRCLRRDGALDEDALVRRLEAEYAAAAALTEGAEPSEAARSEQEAASGLRAELIEALAATGGDRALEALLRAHAMEAESLPRGAVEAALAADPTAGRLPAPPDGSPAPDVEERKVMPAVGAWRGVQVELGWRRLETAAALRLASHYMAHQPPWRVARLYMQALETAGTCRLELRLESAQPAEEP